MQDTQTQTIKHGLRGRYNSTGHCNTIRTVVCELQMTTVACSRTQLDSQAMLPGCNRFACCMKVSMVSDQHSTHASTIQPVTSDPLRACCC